MRPTSHPSHLQRGFSLTELVIVVAIVAVLAMMAVPAMLEAQVRALVARSRSDLRTLAMALQAYAVDAREYPLNGSLHVDETVQVPQVVVGAAPVHKFPTGALTTPVAYITTLPLDPMMVRALAPMPAFAPYWALPFYTNLPHFARMAAPSPPAVIAQKVALHGPWILASAGPDQDRLDVAREISYDPTNGTTSDGDLILSTRQGWR